MLTSPFQRPPSGAPKSPAPSPLRGSLRGLDWFTFFLADVQTGFGPFISVYLTANKWTQTDIGGMLSLTSIVALLGLTPGGALVDAVRSKRGLAFGAVIAVGVSAAAIGLTPAYLVVLVAEVLHGAASCIIGPVVGALTLGLIGHRGISERFGRNACFASIGNGLAAALMGACGYFFSNQAVFFVTAGLTVPTLLALSRICPPAASAAKADAQPIPRTKAWKNALRLLKTSSLPILCGCLALFHLANAAMLPYVGSTLTMRHPETATIFIAACIVVPQLVVAMLSFPVGRMAERRGRRPLLLAGFAALAVRGILFAYVVNPYALVLIQALDGISAAVLGVLVPLIAADITRQTGGFNLAQGMLGTSVGLGATFSTSLVGIISDHLGSHIAFLTLAVIAVGGLVVIWTLLPETRPPD